MQETVKKARSNLHAEISNHSLTSQKKNEERFVSKSFCVLPWVHRFINLGGEHQICCTSEEYDNSIRNFWGQPLKLQNTTRLEQVQNAKSLKKIRQEMLQGIWPAPCERCRLMEKCNGKSRRQIENDRFKDRIPEIIERTNQNGHTSLLPFYLDMRLGNQCNLACRMCHPSASSRWKKEWNQVKEKNERMWFLKNRFKYNWFKKKIAHRQIQNLFSHIEIIHFAGGEPLIIPETLMWLKELSLSSRAKSIEVSFNTNLTVVKEDWLEVLKKFKRVSFYASVDGYGKLNDYIRYPSQWSKFIANVQKISNHSKCSAFFVHFHVTVQIYNILKLHELIDWILSLNLPGVSSLPHLTLLYTPHYFDIRQLPQQLKNQVRDLLQTRKKEWIEKLKPHHQYLFLSNIDAILEHLKFLPTHAHSLQYFFSNTNALDRYRRQNIMEHVPELTHYAPW